MVKIHFDTEEDREKVRKVSMAVMAALETACKEHGLPSDAKTVLNLASLLTRFIVETKMEREFWLDIFDRFAAELRDELGMKKMALEWDERQKTAKEADSVIEKLIEETTKH